MDEKSAGYIRQPSEIEKQTIQAQNAILQKFLQENFGMQPVLISRDKSKHILVVTMKDVGQQRTAKYKKFTAYMLGTDRDKKLTLLTIGKIIFASQSEEVLFIPSLQVVNDYKGCGVGTLLLKLVENYAVDNGYSELELCSLLSAAKLKSVYQKDENTDSGEGLKPLTYPTGALGRRYSSYFDRNLYFYYSNGFEIIDDNRTRYVDIDYIPLAKRDLHATDLQYGVIGKQYLFRQTDPKFRISTLHIDMCSTEDESVHFDGKDVEKSFVPFKCEENTNPVQSLETFLKETPISARGFNS